MEEHPGIAFRDGPAGRRAALAERIRLNCEEADRQHAAWQRAQEALA